MGFFKKFASLAAALAAVFTMSVSVCAHADDVLFDAAGYSRQERELADIIIDTVRKRSNETVDISKYNLSFEEFEDMYVAVLANEPSLFYASSVQAYIGYKDRSHVLSFKPHYNFTKAQTVQLQKEIDKYVNGVLEDMPKSFTDVEKVIYIHDRMGEDIVYFDSGDVEEGRSIYDVFVKKSAICMGYAAGFQYFMDKLEIPCISIYNDDHIWNEVKLDGKWYYVDVTWDDSAGLTEGTVFHNMILLCDSSLENTDPPHESWDYSYPAASKKYENAFWKNAFTSMCYCDGYWYYTSAEGLFRYSFKTGKTGRIYSYTDEWRADDSRVWTISFSRPVEYNGEIYFNTPYKIYRYDPEKNKLYLYYAPEMKDGQQIFDIYVSGDRLVFTVSSDIVSGDTVKRAVKLKNN